MSDGLTVTLSEGVLSLFVRVAVSDAVPVGSSVGVPDRVFVIEAVSGGVIDGDSVCDTVSLGVGPVRL